MNWNHRVWHSVVCGEEVWQIHETSYNESGEICGCAENPVTAMGYTFEELKENMERMLRAIDKGDVLEADGFIFSEWD